MNNDDVLDLVKQCDISKGKVLIPHEAYLFKQVFKTRVSGKPYYQEEEIIVLVWNGVKVGGIYRMGTRDVHWVIKERFRGKHILSNFLKKGIIEDVWKENTSVELCGIYFREDYEKKKHLAELCHMSIRNKAEIEEQLAKREAYRRECEARMSALNQ